MQNPLKSWQRALIRNNMKKYRDKVESDYVQGKRLVEVAPGELAFSLLSPPLGSAAAKRRVRYIARNVTGDMASAAMAVPGKQDETLFWRARTPHFVTIAVSYKCQCDCRHCSAHLYRRQTEVEGSALTHDELCATLNQAVDLGTTGIVLVGGEPLLYPRICDLIASIDSQKSICSMFTNGEFLTVQTARRLKQSGLYGVFVSLDSVCAETHDSGRGRPGLFRKAVEGISVCRDAGLLTGIATYITREKLADGHLDAMVELGRKLGVLEIFVFDVVPTGRLEGECGCVLTDDEAEAVNSFRRTCNEDPERPRIIHQTMFTSMAYPCVAEGCPAAVVQLHVRANGDVSPCDFSACSFGNVRSQPLADIWRAMSEHELYARPSPRCRLADPAFRELLSAITPEQAPACWREHQ